MNVKFTNNKACLQSIYQDGQVLHRLLPGESFVTDDPEMIDKLQEQSDLDAEEVDAKATEQKQAAQKPGKK